MNSRVYILGGSQSDFAVNANRNGLSIADLMIESVQSALQSTKLGPNDIQVGHAANFVSALSSGQAHLGGFFGHVDPAMENIPASSHEAACASGSMALLAAMADIESGRYDLACVTGVEIMRNLPGSQAAENLRGAAWADQEWQNTPYVWPAAFSDMIDEYQQRYQLEKVYLSAISKKNFDNAKTNPNAQTRNWQFEPGAFEQNDDLNPSVIGNIRRQDCGQMTDGAATLFLASESRAKEYANTHKISLDKLPYIKGWGHINAPMNFQQKRRSSNQQQCLFPHVEHLFKQTLSCAGLTHINEIDGLEVHDCFNITEYMILDHSGLYSPGEVWRGIESGDFLKSGKLPVNTSGGLIGAGHPVGVTGIRMALDCFKQVTDNAGDYQIENANNLMTFNLGGSATTCASFIIGT